MRPTRARTLIIATVITAVLAYVLVRANYDRLPVVPRFAPISVVLIGLIELQAAAAVRARLDGRPRTKPILPIVVARFAALAKASSLAGAVVGGAWIGFIAYTLSLLGDVAVASRDSLTGGLGVAAAVVLVVGALVLERSCRVRKPPHGPPARRDDYVR